MGWLKTLISLVLPYVIDAIKYGFRQLTLKKRRDARKAAAVKKAEAYEAAKTDEEVETAFENRT